MSRYKHIAIDPEIHRKAKMHAARLGKSLGEFASEALRDRIRRDNEPPDGLPLRVLLEPRAEYETQEAT